MKAGRVVLTPTAVRHYEAILRYTRREFGLEQMRKYAAQIKDDILKIPECHSSHAGRREEMKGGMDLELQPVQHYYAAYKVLDDGRFAVAAILHQSMNIPERLQELKTMTRQEIAELEREIRSRLHGF